MSRFRKVDVRIWGDAKFAQLSDRGKLAFLYVLTHPGLTALGAMRSTFAGLAAELRWPTRALRNALRPAIAQSMLEVDERAAFIGLPNFVRYNQPESPNVVRAWAAALDLIPECPARRRLLQRVAQYVESLSEGFRKAFREGFPEALVGADPAHGEHPSPNQEQEQEQEQVPHYSLPRGMRTRSTSPREAERQPTVADRTRRVRQRTDSAPPEGFARFWAAYPKKKDRLRALKLWQTLAPQDGLLGQILAALDRQKASEAWRQNRGQYIPHPSTWLRNRRWEDEEPSSDEPEPWAREPIYSNADFDATGALKPEAAAREQARIAGLRPSGGA